MSTASEIVRRHDDCHALPLYYSTRGQTRKQLITVGEALRKDWDVHS
jgi:hypothetical protein